MVCLGVWRTQGLAYPRVLKLSRTVLGVCSYQCVLLLCFGLEVEASRTVLGVCSYHCVLLLILVGGMCVGWGGLAFGGLFDRLPLHRPAIPLRLPPCAYGGGAF